MTYRFLRLVVCMIISLQGGCNLTFSQTNKDIHSTTLSEVLIYARQNNPDIRILENQLKMDRLNIAIEKNEFLPRINAFANHDWFFSDNPVMVFPNSAFDANESLESTGYRGVNVGLPHNTYMGFNATQRILEMSFFNTQGASDVLEQLETARTDDATAELYYQVAKVWYELLQLKEKKEVIEFNQKRLDYYIQLASRQIENDMADSLMLLELSVKKQQLIISQEQYRSGLQRKTGYLKHLVGWPDSLELQVLADETNQPLRISQTYNNVDNYQKLKLLKSHSQVQELKRQKIKSSLYPTLDLKFDWFYSLQSEQFLSGNDYAFDNQIGILGLKLDIPIYNGAEKRKELRIADIEKNNLEIQADKLKSGLSLQINNAEEELLFKQKAVYNQVQLVEIKQQQLEKQMLYFKKGMSDFNKVLDIQESLMDEQVKLKSLNWELKMAELEYLKWTGQLAFLLE